MSYENFSYKVETMKKNKELNELTRVLNSGVDMDLIYKAFADVYMVTISSKLAKGKDGLNVDGLFSDANTESMIYSLLDIVKEYMKLNIARSEAIEETITLARNFYLTTVTDEERSKHLTHVENISVGLGGNLEQLRTLFWDTVKADLIMKANELLH